MIGAAGPGGPGSRTGRGCAGAAASSRAQSSFSSSDWPAVSYSGTKSVTASAHR